MGRVMGYIMASMSIGGIAGPLFGGVIADAAGYKIPFYIIAFACIGAGFIAILLREDSAILLGVQLKLSSILYPVLTNRTLFAACLIMSTVTIGVGIIDLTFPLYLDGRFSTSRTQIGIIFSIFMVFYATGGILSGLIADIKGRRLPLMIGLISTVVIAPLLGVVGSMIWLYLIIALLGVSLAHLGTPILAIITDSFEQDKSAIFEGTRMGAAFSLVNVAWSAGYALGSMMGGSHGGIRLYFSHAGLFPLFAHFTSLSFQ